MYNIKVKCQEMASNYNNDLCPVLAVFLVEYTSEVIYTLVNVDPRCSGTLLQYREIGKPA